jgi:hypothetical protein
MRYDIKAIPTTYNGVRFRSRLEARWAAFFDLARVKWHYEPFDLDGWAPDFLIAAPVREFDQPIINVLVEVKPIDLDSTDHSAFQKAMRHSPKHPVLMCGIGPNRMNNFGALCDLPEFKAFKKLTEKIWYPTPIYWADLNERLSDERAHNFWREAGNLVQWNSAT